VGREGRPGWVSGRQRGEVGGWGVKKEDSTRGEGLGWGGWTANEIVRGRKGKGREGVVRDYVGGGWGGGEGGEWGGEGRGGKKGRRHQWNAQVLGGGDVMGTVWPGGGLWVQRRGRYEPTWTQRCVRQFPEKR